MILGLILCSALLSAFIVLLRVVKPSPSSGFLPSIRYQVDCIFDLLGRWVPYLIAVVPVLVVLALFGLSNQVVLFLEILYLFSLLLLVLFQRIKKAQSLFA